MTNLFKRFWQFLFRLFRRRDREHAGPYYRHDCEKCEYLGSCFYDSPLEMWDMYYCAHQPIGGPTVIARYGNNGEDYLSGLEFGRSMSARDVAMPIAEAYRRAVKRHPELEPVK